MKDSFSHIVKQFFLGLIPIAVLMLSTKLMIRGVGFYYHTNVWMLAFLIILLNSSKKAFWFIAFPCVLLYVVYMPFGFVFGSPSFSYLISVYGSNISEAKEFISQIPLKYFGYALFSLSGVIFFRIFSQKFQLYYHRNKTFLICSAIFTLIYQSPFYYPVSLYKNIAKIYTESKELKKIQEKSTWDIAYLNSRYKNYVLIIGESARKDYHNAYGYPLKDTPFMSSANGIIVDGLTAGGRNTIASLRLMFTLPDTKTWEPNYALNFISLANKANINTIWISNQGYMGIYDTPLSAIAKNSKHTDFLKYGSSSSQNTSDFELLPIFEKRLTEQKTSNQSNLIILHLYGSHPNACDRVIDYDKNFTWTSVSTKYIGCYVSSIRKTDEFIEKVFNMLNANYEHDSKQTFSMIYFADHGLATDYTDKNNITLSQYTVSKHHYDIPLFNISSDSTSRKYIKSKKSGLNFTRGLANWLGIHIQKVPEYNLFDGVNDVDDYGLSKKLKTLSLDDPPIFEK